MNYSIIGFIAGCITSFGFIPQLIRTWRTKKANDISLWQPLILAVGIFLWLVYGLLLGDLPIILANSIALVSNVLLVWLKIRYSE
jgi:MtN3 and saliva related transmembrane protein